MTHVIPWFLAQDYPALKQLCAKDPTLPSTFHEWEDYIADQLASFEQSGVRVEKIEIWAEELAEFCRERGIMPGIFACTVYAIHKTLC